jgi:oligogalacturonide lyase
LNVDTGERWKIRPRDEAGERVGHEYWLQNGEDVGYHGHTAEGDPFVGVVRYDDTDRVESLVDVDTHHAHANTRERIVGDSDASYPHLLLWSLDRDAGEYVGPRRIAEHGSTEQPLHVHPRFSPDGDHVLFTSDRTGYANVYLAEVPEFEALPPASR